MTQPRSFGDDTKRRGPRPPGHGSPAHPRRLAIAGWAAAVIAGGFGLPAILGAALGTF